MENTKKNLIHKILKIIKWIFFVIIFLYIILVIVRAFHFNNLEKTEKQVEVIHSTRITMDDVLGTNLPPDPGEEGNKTIEGIDANKNNIRDDVELAIFKEYPNSAKTRAALLQYALVNQMILTQPFENNILATEVIREHSRADTCLADALVPRASPESFREYSDLEKIDGYVNFVLNLQFNNEGRKQKMEKFYEKVRSYSDLEDECDIDYSLLPN